MDHEREGSGWHIAAACVVAFLWLLWCAHTADCPAGKVAVRSLVAFTCVQP